MVCWTAYLRVFKHSLLEFDGILRVDEGEISLLSKVLRVEEAIATVSSKTQARKDFV